MSVGAAPTVSSGASMGAVASAAPAATASAGSGGAVAASSGVGPGALPSATNIDIGGKSNPMTSSYTSKGAYGMDAKDLSKQIDQLNQKNDPNSPFMMKVLAQQMQDMMQAARG